MTEQIGEDVTEQPAPFNPPYRYDPSVHGPVTIYDAVNVGWVARVKESLPHKERLAAAMVDGLNAAATQNDPLVSSQEVAQLDRTEVRGEPTAAPAPSVVVNDLIAACLDFFYGDDWGPDLFEICGHVLAARFIPILEGCAARDSNPEVADWSPDR